jgi:membrane-bound lytic murein transglycosylase D
MIRKKFVYISLIATISFSAISFAQQEISLTEFTDVIEDPNTGLPNTISPVVKKNKVPLPVIATKAANPSNILVVKGEKTILKDHPLAAKYDSIWLEEMADSANLFEEMYEEVSTLTMDENFSATVDTETLKLRLEKLNQKTPFNIEYSRSLESVIQYFLKRRTGLMERMLTLSQFYFPLFEQELANYNIPIELKYLAIVESALNPRAKSRVGATGLWQFMYPTGKMYNLEVNSYVDERSDPIMATKAACQYLSKLYSIYGDWDLALAAYNSGPGNVSKAIRRSGGATNYWDIRHNLPKETAGYVPAFLATMYLFEYASEHGLKPKNAERSYFQTDTIQVKRLITFDQISKLVDISVQELEVLNPSYKLNIIPFVDNKNYALRLPLDAIGRFVANENEIYAFVENEIKVEEKPLPQFVKTQNIIKYKVKSGDFLGKIAERYGVGVSQIKSWNNLRSNHIKVGQRLIIHSKNLISVVSTSQNTTAKSIISEVTKVHTVKAGDSLWTISKKYSGISIENLRKWNGISGNNLKLGTKLVLCACQP